MKRLHAVGYSVIMQISIHGYWMRRKQKKKNPYESILEPESYLQWLIVKLKVSDAFLILKTCANIFKHIFNEKSFSPYFF